MRRFLADMNPTLRGFLIILLITGVIVALSLEDVLSALWLIASIAFLVAIAFFVYVLWRERRGEIGMWSPRAQIVFYGAAILILVDLVAYFVRGAHGVNAAIFLIVLGISGFSMWRVWRDQHQYVPPTR